jgi:hypothetical protein
MTPDGKKTAVTILLGTVAAGALLWPVPYGELDFTSRGFLLPWLAAGAAAGFAARVLVKQHTATTAALIALGYVVAVMGRVVVELMADPTDHNLWPFEVVIGGGIGLLGGAIGALLGSLAVGSRAKR